MCTIKHFILGAFLGVLVACDIPSEHYSIPSAAVDKPSTSRMVIRDRVGLPKQHGDDAYQLVVWEDTQAGILCYQMQSMYSGEGAALSCVPKPVAVKQAP
jgi:hypothetical protein